MTNQSLLKNRTIRLLHIEDNASDVQLFDYLLKQNSQQHYQISVAESLHNALATLEKENFDVIILDLTLPDSIGLNTLESLKSTYADTPIIVLTGTHDERIVRQAIRCGAQDYIHKGEIDGPMVSRTIYYAIERKHTENQLKQLARHDSLTGLVNRSVFIDRLNRCLLRKERLPEKTQISVMMLDLDNFKNINDTLGHAVGDQLLIEVSKRINDCIRKGDTLSRLGGDEFTLLFESHNSSIRKTQMIADKILQALSQPFEINGNIVFTSGSLGISIPMATEDLDSAKLLKQADMAMYLSKEKGGNQYSFFTKDLQVAAQLRADIEASLRKALDEKQLFLMYQPQIDITQGKIYGIEALVRWRHPHHGVLSPAMFLDILEETGLIVIATEWIIEEALVQWKRWRESGIIDEQTNIAINLSPKFMRHPRIHETLEKIIKDHEIDPKLVDLEFTENIFIDSTTQNIKTIQKLKDSGFKLSIDDFGTGFSSLSYLKNFEIDCIKLDRSFIKDILHCEKDAAIASVIIELGRKLKINVVAEGVEDLETLSLLKKMNCNIIQGYLFSKPLDSEQMPMYIQEKKYNQSLQ